MGIILQEIITAAQTAVVYEAGLLPAGRHGLTLQATLVYGSGGTTLKAWVQTSLDDGATWFDVACFAFATANKSRVATIRGDAALTTLATPGDGVLADDTVVNGVLGDRLRCKLTSTGIYAGDTTLTIAAVAR